MLFSVPALVLFRRDRDPGAGVHGPVLDAADRLGVGAALAGGLALSIRLAWLPIGRVRPAGAAPAEAYMPLVMAAILGHFNLLPFALAGAGTRSRAPAGAGRRQASSGIP